MALIDAIAGSDRSRSTRPTTFKKFIATSSKNSPRQMEAESV
jgi:hypothetical protein